MKKKIDIKNTKDRMRFYIYQMFFRYLKDNGLYYEFITFGSISKNRIVSSDDMFLVYLRKIFTSDQLTYFASNLIDDAFTWSECNAYFGTETDWGKHHLQWGRLVENLNLNNYVIK